ncbi:MAG TPA: OmpA family protein [Rhizomicrobium sp.]|nr:OmpA family protein [Rhizomicrobium sp.]
MTTPAITPAQAGEGWYLGLGAGWDSLTSTHITGAGLDGKVHGRDTALFDASAGYKFGNFRIEAETGWDRHHLDDFTSGGLSDPLENGHLEMRSLMVNGVYDIPLTSRFRLSLGAGAGVGNQRIKFTDPALATTFSNSDRTRFMWQGIGGLSYEVNPQVDLFVDYRYRSNVGNASDVLASTIRSHDVNEQAVIAGFRWYPGAHEERVAYEPPPAPPAPPPPPPAPPAPPPAVKTFIVFFDFNKSNLTPEAVTVVGDAVKEAKTTGAVRVLVTGHTDTVGSDAYNQALSVRRAQSVKDQMVADGMAGDTIAIEGKSFHDPLVATGPGVREPQNRRAVIDLNGNG